MRALRHTIELLELTLPFPLSTRHRLLGALPDKALFQLKEAPGFAERFVTAIQAHEEEIGQDGQGYRASDTFRGLRHLHLPQVQAALQFLNGDLHTPTPCVYAENRPRTRLGEIGHENFHTLRPIVTPFLRQDNRDIAQIMERGAAEKDPGVPAPPIRFVAGTAVVTTFGSMLHEVPQMFAIRKFSGAWHSKDIRVMFFRNQAQGSIGRKAGIRDHHDLSHPYGRHKILPHLSKEDVLMSFNGRVNCGEGHWDTTSAPTRYKQAHLKPKRIRIMRTVACRMPQGMLPPALVFQRAISDEIEDAIGWRRERPERGHRHVTYHRFRVPLARTKHPQGRPLVECGWQIRREPFERAFARIANQRHQQPTKDQNVLCLGAAKMPRERVEHLIYFAWDACATPHVSRSCAFWHVGCIQNTQERFFFQAF